MLTVFVCTCDNCVFGLRKKSYSDYLHSLNMCSLFFGSTQGKGAEFSGSFLQHGGDGVGVHGAGGAAVVHGLRRRMSGRRRQVHLIHRRH